jgi:hypothetical protein
MMAESLMDRVALDIMKESFAARGLPKEWQLPLDEWRSCYLEVKKHCARNNVDFLTAPPDIGKRNFLLAGVPVVIADAN